MENTKQEKSLSHLIMGGGIVLIPAYKPTDSLIEFVGELLCSDFAVVVVNDGSPQDFDSVFSSLPPQVSILRHAINLGKGAALKSGINSILTQKKRYSCIITADCDGQHSLEDIKKLYQTFIQNDVDLALGVRDFDKSVPLRSRFGNKLTQKLFKLMYGKNIADTQTGLRAFSYEFAKNLLKIPYNGYEFEMDMLIQACNNTYKILQTPIHTIYIDNNASSHFNPFLDSLNIYFVLFRHITNSLITALLDYVVFVLSFGLSGSLFVSMLCGRIIAGSFNFIIGKRFVFKSKNNMSFEIISYCFLTLILMLLSYKGIEILSVYSGVSEIIIKPICELGIFAISFLVQRFVIFKPQSEVIQLRKQDDSCDLKNTSGGGHSSLKATDWENYYKKRGEKKKLHIANLTRKWSARMILSALPRESTKICEFGGGDSCFYQSFRAVYQNAKYVVFDSSENGVMAFNQKYAQGFQTSKQIAYQLNVLESYLCEEFDIVFSVGLIEHFGKDLTQAVIERHFEACKSGGYVLITYPTPTSLYCFIRGVLEYLKMWEFHDERPLLFDEVHSTCKKFGALRLRKLNWPILLTQEVLVYQKH